MNLHQRSVAVADGGFVPDEDTTYHIVRRLSHSDDPLFIVEHENGRREVKRESVIDAERPYLRDENGFLIAADHTVPDNDQRFGYLLAGGAR